MDTKLIKLIKNFSIPLELNVGDVGKYSECKMYDRNYTELIQMWMIDENPNNILINSANLLSNNDNFEIINCKHGWIFEKTMFSSTVISEVCMILCVFYSIHFIKMINT